MLSIWSGPKFCCLFMGKQNDKNLDLSKFKAFPDSKSKVAQMMKLAFYSLPKDKFLNWSKFKAFADDNVNVNQKQKFFLGWVESNVGKGENAAYQHFLLFPQCFQKHSSQGR